MDSKIERVSEKKEDGHGQSPKHQNPTSPTIISLPPSSSSSPSQDFSFTISLQPPSLTKSPDKSKPTPSSVAIDLSPADDIFYHGHLLPLQLISRLRRPTSSDNLNRPAHNHTGDQKLKNNHSNGSTSINKGSSNTAAGGAKERNKSKSFMVRLAKWRKAFENSEASDDVKMKKKKKKKKKPRFDMGGFLKRYMSLIPPLFSRGGKEKRDIRRQPYSISGHLNSKLKGKVWRRGGGFSAPASMRTSPTNSGLLFATATTTTASPSNNSTMEELQNAIQAAIAHCKSSIAAKEDKCKC